jgi:hypothetical protein
MALPLVEYCFGTSPNHDANSRPLEGSAVAVQLRCPKRTGHNKLLFSDLNKQDTCTNPNLLFEICRPGTRGV